MRGYSVLGFIGPVRWFRCVIVAPPVTFLVAYDRNGKRKSPMQEYAPEAEGGAFAQSRALYGELEDWLSGEDAGKLRHAELEDQLQERAVSCCAGCTRITWTCWRHGSSAATR